MPKKAVELDAVARVAPLKEIPGTILNRLS
jgi:chemotaxis response regulator CheB